MQVSFGSTPAGIPSPLDCGKFQIKRIRIEKQREVIEINTSAENGVYRALKRIKPLDSGPSSQTLV
jgi:hypothetical protein